LIGYGIRICVPLLIGFVIARYFGPEGALAASFGAAMGALLLSWPVIMLWDLVVSPGFKPLYAQFLLLYLLNMITFFYMAKLGSIFGLQVSAGPIQSISLPKIVESSLIAIVGGAGSKFVEHLILAS
jgi:hypothetical protein